MPEDQKNFLLAIAFSLLVLFLWEVYFSPQSEPPPPATATSQTSPQSVAPQAQTVAPSGKRTAAPISAWGAQPLAANKRQKVISLQTPSVQGSIQQKGSLINNLSLKKYRETIDENSPLVQFLKPNNFDALFGWSSVIGEIINGQTPWRLASRQSASLSEGKKITLVYQDKKTGLSFRRTIAVDENYVFQIEDEVINRSTQPQQIAAWGMVRRKNYPATSGFYLLHEGLIGFTEKQGLEEIDYDDLEEEGSIKLEGKNGWLGFTDKYWAAVLIPDQQKPFRGTFSHQALGSESIWRTQYITESFSLQAGQTLRYKQHFFAGAKKTSLIDAYEQSLPAERFDLMIDWGWFFFMTKPFFLMLDFFSQLLGNFGMAILVVTIVVKLLFFPLANRSYETMAVMRKVQPELERVRARYKGDMMAQNKEIAELWRKHDVKPLMGCLPMLLQIPVFFALYKVLFVTIEMRHAPFFGWIEDLSAADPTSLLTLFGLIPIPLPDFLIIGIWPLIMGVAMFVQMRLNPPPPDPIQRKVFAWAPFVITLLLARFPAGLVIYAAWNTILSALQQGVIMKKQGVEINLLDNLGIKK